MKYEHSAEQSSYKLFTRTHIICPHWSDAAKVMEGHTLPVTDSEGPVTGSEHKDGVISNIVVMFDKDFFRNLNCISSWQYIIHYIILNNGILKSNSSVFSRSKGYISHYTS